jgi:hypothetical protein
MPNAQQLAKDSGPRPMDFQPMSTSQTASHTTSQDLPLPLEAAQSVVAGYIQTLHFDLQSFLLSLTQSCLTAYNNYHNHTVRTQDLITHPNKIPPSIKNLKYTLQPLDEQIGSEGYQALQSNLNLEMDLLHRKLVDNFVNPFNKMKTAVYLKRFHLTFCKLLREGTKVFVAQLNLINYSPEEAIINLVATKPPDFFTAPLPTDIPSFLILYKEANEVTWHLPLPTNNDAELSRIITNVNKGSVSISSPPEMQLTTQTIHTDQGGHSPPSSVTTSTLEGILPCNMETSVDSSASLPQAQNAITTSTPGLIPPTNTVPTVTPGTFIPPTQTAQISARVTNPAVQQGTLHPSPQAVQSPYVVRTTLQQTTPRNPASITLDNTTDTTLPMPPVPGTEDCPAHPSMPETGIQGTPFFSANTVLMAQQLTESLMNNLAQSNSPFTADESVITRGQGDTSPTNNFSSQPEFSEEDLSSITTATNKHVLNTRIIELYTNTVLLPIQKFCSTVTAREERFRIRSITSSSLQNSLSAKVAAKIQAERPADRATLRGLIHEEQEKSTALIRQQLQSALHRLDRFEKQQEDKKKLNQRPSISKNSRGGNTNNNKDARRNETSIVVAESSTSNRTSSTPTPSAPPPTQGWGRKRPHVSFSIPSDRNSVTPNDNVSAAPKQKRQRNWRRPKPQRNSQH